MEFILAVSTATLSGILFGAGLGYLFDLPGERCPFTILAFGLAAFSFRLSLLMTSLHH